MRNLDRPVRLVPILLATAMLLLNGTSCGTILYPERCGQPRGRLDPGVVLLDAAGLLLFFIPGVVAFAVDFTNGTIYLPPDGCDPVPMQPMKLQKLSAVKVDPRALSQRKIEEVLAEHTGRPVSLNDDSVRIRKIEQPSELPVEYATLLSDGSHAPTKLRFASLPK